MDRREFLKSSIYFLASYSFFEGSARAIQNQGKYHGNLIFYEYNPKSGKSNLLLYSEDNSTFSSINVPSIIAHSIERSPLNPNIICITEEWKQEMFIFDLEKEKIISSLKLPKNEEFIGHQYFSPDGERLLLSQNKYSENAKAMEGFLVVYDMKNFKEIDRIKSGGVSPHQFKLFSNNKEMLILNTGNDFKSNQYKNPLLGILNLEKNEVSSLIGLPGTMTHLDTDGEDFYIIGSKPMPGNTHEGHIVHYSKRTGLKSLERHPDQSTKFNFVFLSVAYCKKNQTLAVTSPRENKVFFYDTKTFKPLRSLDFYRAASTSLSPSGNHFYVASREEKYMYKVDSKNLEKAEKIIFNDNKALGPHCLTL